MIDVNITVIKVTETLRKFEKSLIISLKEMGWDGKEEEDTVGNIKTHRNFSLFIKLKYGMRMILF